MNTTSNTKMDKTKSLIADHKYRAISTLCDLNGVFSAALAEASNTVTASELNLDQSEAYAKLIDLEWEMERLANSLTKAHQAAMKIMARSSAT
jgi:hypothetical protein